MTNKPIIERGVTVAGEAPTAAWVSFEVEVDLHMVYLVGIEDAVRPTHEALRNPTAFRRGIRLPLATLNAYDKVDPSIQLPLALMILGNWKTYEEAKGVVMSISNSADDGEKEWVPRIRKVVRAHRAQIVSSRFEIPHELVVTVLEQFMGECAWALEQDGLKNLKCPCGARVKLVSTDEEGKAAVMHEEPTCKEFDKRDSDDYADWVLVANNLDPADYKEGELEQLAELQCSCGEPAHVVRNVNTGEKEVLHADPWCETYDKLDPGAYLKQVESLRVACPCGAKVVLTRKDPDGEASVTHPNPQCDEFKAASRTEEWDKYIDWIFLKEKK